MSLMIRFSSINIFLFLFLFLFSVYHFSYCHRLYKSRGLGSGSGLGSISVAGGGSSLGTGTTGFIHVGRIINNSNDNRKENRRKAELFSKIEIKMPALSSTMTSGKIVKWNKNIGDYINAGDIIMTVESDKADMDVEAFDEGYLRKKSFNDGAEANVGDILGIMTTEANEAFDEDSVTSTSPLPSSDNNATSVADDSNHVDLNDKEERNIETKEQSVGSKKEIEVIKTNVQDVNIYVPHIMSKKNRVRINKWLKKENEFVHAKEILFYVEDDKSTVEVESEHEGVLKQILVEEGKFADLDKAVAVISTKETEGTSSEHKHNYFKETEEREQINEHNVLDHYKNTLNRSPEGKTFLSNLTEQEKNIFEERLKLNFEKYNHASGKDFLQGNGFLINQQKGDITTKETSYQIILPSAADLMKQHRIDPAQIIETKTPNRITYEDVDNFIKNKSKTKQSELNKALNTNFSSVTTSPSSPSSYSSSDSRNENKTDRTSNSSEKQIGRIVELSNIQKAIKNNMMMTLNVPVFRVTHLIKTNELLKLYNKIKDKISMSVILNKCVATVLLKHPLIYSTYIEEGNGKIMYHEDVNIGNALGLSDSLLTPVLKKVNRQNIYALSDMWKELVKKGKSGTLTASEMTDSNFYISNLGMFNTYQFDAILPKNASCILSVGTNINSIENFEELNIKRGMMMTLTCDHRHIYGSHAAAFMSDLSQFIENDIMNIFL